MQKTKFCFVFMLYAKQHNCMLDLNKAGLVYFLEVTEMMTALKKNGNYLQENEYTQNCYLYKGNAVYNSKTSKILSNETSSF